MLARADSAKPLRAEPAFAPAPRHFRHGTTRRPTAPPRHFCHPWCHRDGGWRTRYQPRPLTAAIPNPQVYIRIEESIRGCDVFLVSPSLLSSATARRSLTHQPSPLLKLMDSSSPAAISMREQLPAPAAPFHAAASPGGNAALVTLPAALVPAGAAHQPPCERPPDGAPHHDRRLPPRLRALRHGAALPPPYDIRPWPVAHQMRSDSHTVSREIGNYIGKSAFRAASRATARRRAPARSVAAAPHALDWTRCTDISRPNALHRARSQHSAEVMRGLPERSQPHSCRDCQPAGSAAGQPAAAVISWANAKTKERSPTPDTLAPNTLNPRWSCPTSATRAPIARRLGGRASPQSWWLI